jgi:hypothetical protein
MREIAVTALGVRKRTFCAPGFTLPARARERGAPSLVFILLTES